MEEVVLEGKSMTATPQEKRLIAKLAQVMGETSWIEKRGQNQQQRYNYAMESDFLDAVRKKLAAQNVFVLTSITDSRRVETGKRTSNGTPIFAAEVETLHTFHDGDTGEILEVRSAGWGEDSGDKAIYKAITGAMKYFVSKTFMLPTGDDPEADEEEKPVKQKRAKGGPSWEERQIANAVPQQDQGTFEDRIKSGSKLKEGSTNGKPWTLYKIETEGHGDFTTFSKTVFDAAKWAKAQNMIVTVHSEPGSKGPTITEIELPAERPSAQPSTPQAAAGT